MKIISGGQSGVDRAALDFCLENNIPCGGWCPKGRLAEDGIIPKKYPLKETQSEHYEERTMLNVRNSDATLILYQNEMDAGTLYTLDLAEEMDKPFYTVNFSQSINMAELIAWLDKKKIKTLNIAGPRESSNPGIYKRSLQFLNEIGKQLILSQ